MRPKSTPDVSSYSAPRARSSLALRSRSAPRRSAREATSSAAHATADMRRMLGVAPSQNLPACRSARKADGPYDRLEPWLLPEGVECRVDVEIDETVKSFPHSGFQPFA